MDTILDILRALDEDPSMQKRVDLVQIIVVISSGILFFYDHCNRGKSLAR